MTKRRLQAMPYPCTKTVELDRPGGKKVRKTFVDVGVVEAFLTEVSSSDAPVAARWRVWTHVPGRNGPAITVEARHFDGAFHVPLSLADGARARPHDLGMIETTELGSRSDHRTKRGVTLFSSISACGDVPFSGREVVALMEVFNRGSTKVDRSLRLGTVVASNEENGRAAATRFIEGLLVIDGEVWTRVHEPRLALVGSLGARNRVWWSADVWFGGDRYEDPTWLGNLGENRVGPPSKTKFFALDDFDGLCAAAAQVGLDPRATPERFGAIEVLMPEVFAFEPEENATERAVAHALAILEPGLGDASPEAVSAWLSIREAFDRWTADADVDALRAASLSVRTMTPCVDGDLRSEIEACLPFLEPDARDEGPDAAPGGVSP
jgi:hypothetical protein